MADKDAEVIKFIDIDVHTLCILWYCAQSHEMFFVLVCEATCYLSLTQAFTNDLQTIPISKQHNFQ